MNEFKPLISIIVPIYKVEQFLDEAIQSILNQTYRDIEIILVDDGSPDNCGYICDQYAEKDARIVVIHKENGGLSDARNAGLAICKGTYLAFVDSDDVIHPQFIELLYTAIQSANNKQVKIACCCLENFEEKIVIKEFKQYNSITNSKTFSNVDYVNLLFEEQWLPTSVVVWNKLYHKSIFNNIRFPKGENHEDEYVFFEIYTQALEVVFFDYPLYFYRKRSGSIMSNKFTDKNVASFSGILKKRMEFAIKTENKALQNKIKNLSTEYFSAASFFSKKEYEASRNFNFGMQVIQHPTIHWKTKILFLKNLIFNPFK